MAAIYDPRVKRWVGTGAEPEDGPGLQEWVDAVAESRGELDDRNLLSSAPTPLRAAVLEILGEWTPYVPKAAPEPESSEPLPPLTLPRYRS